MCDAQRVVELIEERCSGQPGRFVDFLAGVILKIDQKLSEQLSEIIEHTSFKALEASWRGVESVVCSLVPNGGVKVRILDFSWEDVTADLQGSMSVYDTLLYRNIASRELDTLGGEPFGIMLVDHALSLSIDNLYDDFYIAQLVCFLGQKCCCPFIMSIDDDFFGEVSADWVTDTRRMSSIFSGGEHAVWRRLRAFQESQFLGIAWPGFLARGRYESYNIGFQFHQRPLQSSGLWAHGGYAFLRSVIAEYNRTAWFGFLKFIGNTSGEGAVLRSNPAPIPKGTTRKDIGRIRFTQAMGRFFSSYGIIPLCQSMVSQDLYFWGNSSVFDTRGDPALGVLTQLQSILIACRMVHYIKSQSRHMVGRFQDADEFEHTLNRWLERYCSDLTEASLDMLARYPLRSAEVKVTERGADQTRLSCAIYIRPQYQIDHLEVNIKLSAYLSFPVQEAA